MGDWNTDICVWCSNVFLKKPKHKQYCKKSCKTNARKNRKKIIASEKKTCSMCGFVAIHKCQLDIDHVDGNHQNNDSSNLQILCANCHRLKTQKQRWG